jgi:hypothetical protein
MNIEDVNTKTILYNPCIKPKKKKEPRQPKLAKEKKDRVVTKTSKWTLQEEDYNHETQLSILTEIKTRKTKETQFLYSEINNKLHSYKQQDVHKNKYDGTLFITLEQVMNKLEESRLLCFYCKEPMKIWYKQARDNSQWTLERINNEQGHNINNVEISCLLCNIRRRCMYHEKFRFTKQVKICRVEEESKNIYKEEN